MALFSTDDLGSTQTDSGYGLQQMQQTAAPQMQQAQLVNQLQQQKNQNYNQIFRINPSAPGGIDAWNQVAAQIYNQNRGVDSQIQNLQQQTVGSNPLPALNSYGTSQDLAQSQSARLAKANVPFNVGSQFLPTEGLAHYGVASQPETVDSLLQRPEFHALLQNNPNQAHALFGAMTNQDLGGVLKEKAAIHDAQISNAAKDIQDKIGSGNLHYDENGMPQVQEQNPITGQKVWKSVNNSDPTKQLPIETAMQLLNHDAMARAGIPITAKHTASMLALDGMSKGLKGQQLANYIKFHQQNGGQAMTAQDVQPAILQNQVQQSQLPSQPSGPPTGQGDIQAIANLVHSVRGAASTGGGIAANTIRGIGGTIHNAISANVINPAIRARNLFNAVVEPGSPDMPFRPILNPNQMYQ